MRRGVYTRWWESSDMHEAVFRIADGGFVADATVDRDVRVTLWCNEYCDLLHAVGSDAGTVVDEIGSHVGLRTEANGKSARLAVTETCLKEHIEGYIEHYLARHDCLRLPPLRYADGEKRARVLSIDPEGLTGVYHQLVDEGYGVQVEQKRELAQLRQRRPLLTLEEVLPDLSERQSEALRVAHERGYYEVPRETTTADIADALGVQRRTAEEHLRRAELKTADALLPYLHG